jgi:hypothetical protein
MLADEGRHKTAVEYSLRLVQKTCLCLSQEFAAGFTESGVGFLIWENLGRIL